MWKVLLWSGLYRMCLCWCSAALVWNEARMGRGLKKLSVTAIANVCSFNFGQGYNCTLPSCGQQRKDVFAATIVQNKHHVVMRAAVFSSCNRGWDEIEAFICEFVTEQKAVHAVPLHYAQRAIRAGPMRLLCVKLCTFCTFFFEVHHFSSQTRLKIKMSLNAEDKTHHPKQHPEWFLTPCLTVKRALFLFGGREELWRRSGSWCSVFVFAH